MTWQSLITIDPEKSEITWRKNKRRETTLAC